MTIIITVDVYGSQVVQIRLMGSVGGMTRQIGSKAGYSLDHAR